MAMDALLRMIARQRRTLVIAYPLAPREHRRLRAACRRAHRALVVVTLATPLAIALRGRGQRALTAAEQARTRQMHAEGYHRRRFAALTLANAQPPPGRTARRIARLLHRLPVTR